MVALGTRDLTLSLGGSDTTVTLSNCHVDVVDAEDGFKSFISAKEGGKKQWRLRGTMAQDMDANSIHTKVRTLRGTTIAALLKPAGGGAAPSASQQHVTGNVTLLLPDGVYLGGEADENPEARFTWDFDFPFTAEPTFLAA